MTPKEAIKTLEVAKAEVEWNYPLDYAIAMEMAIMTLGAIEQIMWERDMAISQLEEIGVSFGEKMDEVKEALEKQIPKKPIIYTDTRNLLDYNGNDYGVREVDVYDCPNCGFDISDKSVCEEYEYKPSCCPECGQKLNWEDWSEEE